MKEFRIKNAKGLFLETRVQCLLTEDTYQYLRDVHLPSLTDEKVKEQREAALDLIGSLPVSKLFTQLTPVDSNYTQVSAKGPETYVNHKWTTGYGWVRPGTAKGASNNSSVAAGNPKEAGWEDAAALVKVRATLNEMLKAVGGQALGEDDMPNAASLKKIMASLVFEGIDPERDLAQCEGFALFIGGSYLDSKGHGGPLSRARMFESAEAAARTARSQRWPNWKAVRVGLAVVGQCELQGDTPQPELAGIVSRLEAEALNKALEDAGIERLKQKVLELTAAQATESPEPEPAPKPRARL